jgi:hypothetical protein
MAGKRTTAASASGGAGFNLPHGAAPSAPANGDAWSTTGGLFFQINGVTRQAATLDGNETLTNKTLNSATLATPTMSGTATFQGMVLTVASAVGGAGFRLPHGAAPTAPTNGDLWTTTTGLFVRLNGTTRQAATIDGAETLTNKTLTSPVITAADSASTVNAPTGTAYGIGFRGIPPRAATTGQVLTVNDNGTEIEITTGGVTVPTGLPADFVCVIFNNSATPQTITQGAGLTLRQVGSTNTGSRTLAGYGSCTIRGSATASLAKISGVGLS